jgi:hypothetical protein
MHRQPRRNDYATQRTKISVTVALLQSGGRPPSIRRLSVPSCVEFTWRHIQLPHPDALLQLLTQKWQRGAKREYLCADF